MSQCSDMIEMSMSKQDSSDLMFIFLEIWNIRNNIICSQFFCSGKFHTRIDDKEIVLIFDEHALSYLLKSKQTSDFDRYFSFFDKLARIFDRCNRSLISMTEKCFRSHFGSWGMKRFFTSIRWFWIVFSREINREISLHRRWWYCFRLYRFYWCWLYWWFWCLHFWLLWWIWYFVRLA